MVADEIVFVVAVENTRGCMVHCEYCPLTDGELGIFRFGGYRNLGKKLGEWSGSYGSQATKEKEFVGTVSNYFVKSKIAEIKIETGSGTGSGIRLELELGLELILY